MVVTGSAPTSGNVYPETRGENPDRGAINNQGREEEATRERKVHEERNIARVEKTKELQFFILEEESNQKSVR